VFMSFFFQADDGIRDFHVTGVQTCALPISHPLVSGSQGIYRASFDATESLLSVFPDESIVGRAEQCKAGTPVFDSTHGPRGGLRSEERRVGKECRGRGQWYSGQK